MLTNNFYAFYNFVLCYNRCQLSAVDTNNKNRYLGTYLHSQGYQSYRTPFFKHANNILNGTTSGNAGVMFGDSATPPTLTDYKLGHVINPSWSISASQTADVKDSTLVRSGIYTITNSSESDITINEVGYFTACACFDDPNSSIDGYPENYNSASSRRNFLIDRTVLDEPLVIPPGEIGKLTYTITMPILLPPTT